MIEFDVESGSTDARSGPVVKPAVPLCVFDPVSGVESLLLKLSADGGPPFVMMFATGPITVPTVYCERSPAAPGKFARMHESAGSPEGGGSVVSSW